MSLDALAEAIDGLAVDPSTLGDPVSVVTLHRELARLESVLTTATASFDTSGAWALDGARNAAAWLASRCRISRSRARREVRRGRVLRDLPHCARAWSTGQISAEHVDTIVALRRDATRDALVRDEELLVSQARELHVASFVRAAAYWEQCADPDGVEQSAEEQRAARNVQLTPGFRGTWLGRMTLDAISGEIVANELRRLEQTLFDTDRAEARERVGRDPVARDLARTAAQRRADALVEMATRSSGAAADAPRPAPLFSVYLDYPTLFGRICELASGLVVTPGSLAPYLDRAMIERAVFGPTGRVEIGARTRLFTGATRRAIELRDRRCTHPCCDEPAVRCQVDHIVPFSLGGESTQENGQLLCGYHNRLRNTRPPPGASSRDP